MASCVCTFECIVSTIIFYGPQSVTPNICNDGHIYYITNRNLIIVSDDMVHFETLNKENVQTIMVQYSVFNNLYIQEKTDRQHYLINTLYAFIYSVLNIC